MALHASKPKQNAESEARECVRRTARKRPGLPGHRRHRCSGVSYQLQRHSLKPKRPRSKLLVQVYKASTASKKVLGGPPRSFPQPWLAAPEAPEAEQLGSDRSRRTDCSPKSLRRRRQPAGDRGAARRVASRALVQKADAMVLMVSGDPGSSAVTPGRLLSQVSWRLASWRVAMTPFSRSALRSMAPSRCSHACR